MRKSGWKFLECCLFTLIGKAKDSFEIYTCKKSFLHLKNQRSKSGSNGYYPKVLVFKGREL